MAITINGQEILSAAEYAAEMRGARKRLTACRIGWARCAHCSRSIAEGEKVYRWRAGYSCAVDCLGAKQAIERGRYERRGAALKARREGYTLTLGEAEGGGYDIVILRNHSGEELGRAFAAEKLGWEGARYDGRMGWLGSCALDALRYAQHSLMQVGADALYCARAGGYVKFEWAEWAKLSARGPEFSGSNEADAAELLELLERAESSAARVG